MPNPLPEKDVLIVGVAGAGKTALAKNLIGEGFAEYYPPTIGAQVFSIKGPDDKNVTVWDVAGDKRYHKMAELYYKKAHVVMLVLDKSRDFFEQQIQLEYLKEQQERIRAAVRPNRPTFVLVITKSDIANNAAIPDESLSHELGITSIVHCSAKTNEYMSLVREMLQGNLAQKQVEAQQDLVNIPALNPQSLVEEINNACKKCLETLSTESELRNVIISLKECVGGASSAEQKLQNFQRKYNEIKPLIAAELQRNDDVMIARAVHEFQNAVAVIQLQDHCKKFLENIRESRSELLSVPIPDQYRNADLKLLARKAQIVEGLLKGLIEPGRNSEYKLRTFHEQFKKDEKILSQKTYKDNITFGFLVGLSVITGGLGALAIAIHTYVTSDKKRFGFWEPREESVSKEMDDEIANAPVSKRRKI